MRSLLLVFLVLWVSIAAAQTGTKNTLPSANSSFLTDTQTFLREEDAERFQDMFSGFVVSGCTHGTVAGLTGTPTSCTAYPGGFYTTETASITYPDSDTCWVIMDSVTTGNLSPFNRVSGTNYLTDCTSATEPTLPANTVWMMKVTTSGGSVSAVVNMTTSNGPPLAYAKFLDGVENADEYSGSDMGAKINAAFAAIVAPDVPVHFKPTPPS